MSVKEEKLAAEYLKESSPLYDSESESDKKDVKASSHEATIASKVEPSVSIEVY